jgi:hypothetical protein
MKRLFAAVLALGVALAAWGQMWPNPGPGHAPYAAGGGGGGTATFENATEIIETADTATITVTPPASLAEGNMWLILLTWDAESGSSIGTPSGFTKIGSDIVGADDGWPHSVLFYKIAGASESNATITRTGGDNFDRVAYSIRISGTAALSLDATGTPTTTTGEGTVIDAPNITIAQDNSLAVLHGASVGTPTSGPRWPRRRVRRCATAAWATTCIRLQPSQRKR